MRFDANLNRRGWVWLKGKYDGKMTVQKMIIPSITTGNRQCSMFHTEVQEAYRALTKSKKKTIV